MADRFIIIDGNSLMNRAYYAIQRPMITKDGIYTQGIFGFLNMLSKILKDYSPQYIAVAFDRKAPTFRHNEYEEYKAGRKKMPLELAMQFPLLKEILSSMNIHMEEIDGFEADDIIGTFAFEAEKQGLEPIIITGDKDALQLATHVTKIIFTKRGISEFEVYDYDKMIEKYGLTPDQFIDLKGLMGDSSDNIPGIPGVGEKTALKLLHEYGSVENVISSTDSMKKSKLRDKIEENAQLAMMSKKLATINKFVPIDTDFDKMHYTKPDYDALIEIFKKLEFNSFIKKLINANPNLAKSTSLADSGTNGSSGSNDNETSAARKLSAKESSDTRFNKMISDISESRLSGSGAKLPFELADGYRKDDDENSDVTDEFSFLLEISPNCEIVIVKNDDDFESMKNILSKEKAVWLKVLHDENHIEKPTIFSVAIAIESKMFFISWKPDSAKKISEIFKNYEGKICGHDLKSDYYALLCCGAAEIYEGNDHIFDTGFDTAVAEYLADPQKNSYEMSTIALENFHENFPSDKKLLEEISQFDMFGNIYEKQAELSLNYLRLASRFAVQVLLKLKEMSLISLLRHIELPLIEVLADMECTGIKANRDTLDEIGKILKSRIEEISENIYEAAGEKFNINSPKQLGVILFEKLGLPAEKKTKTGYSTNAEVLENLAKEHKIAEMILEYRMLTKLNGTYVDGMLPLIDASGRIHAHFQQTVTATGRLSCTEPNLQNIPVRQDLGRLIRKVFCASDDSHVLTGADYSQIELRVMAHLSDDPALKDAFINNLDIHTSTASRVFGVPLDEVSSLQRRRAKAVNFGVIYGISAFGLSKDLKISRKEAATYIDDYFSKHPFVKQFMNDIAEYCKSTGYVVTMHGRRRNINEITASNRVTRQLGERLAANTPVQGTAADIMKLAMIETYRRLNAKVPDAKIVLQVHDELIIECRSESKDEVSKILEESMTGAADLSVPLVAEVNTGTDWYSLK